MSRSVTTVTGLLAYLAEQFEELHTVQEEAFWIDHMHLSGDAEAASKRLVDARVTFNAFCSNPEHWEQVQDALTVATNTEDVIDLHGWQRLFDGRVIHDPNARALQNEVVGLETMLGTKRNGQTWGLMNPLTGVFEKMGQRQMMLIALSDPSEMRRRAAHNGQLKVEPFLLENGYIELVKLRNRLARTLGYEDFYDMRVQQIEGMSKTELFNLLDRFVDGIKDKVHQTIDRFAAEFGDSVREPWNVSYYTKGKTAGEIDPYFDFTQVIKNWLLTYASLGIDYDGASLTMDLMDRVDKYPNGFMHIPGLTVDARGTHQAAKINLASNAVPNQMGSGLETLRTLLHECGHAAHFARMRARAPCLVSEYLPIATGLLESQSKFLDGFAEDPLWRARYLTDRAGNPMPPNLILKAFAEEKRMRGFAVMNGLTTVLGERQVYEMDENEMTPDRMIEDARSLERRLLGTNGAMRPIFSVPHLLDGDSAANYHSYALAAMGVAQMRAFFLKRDGYLIDNPKIGPDIAEHFWTPGGLTTLPNALVSMTGEPFSPDAFIDECNVDVEAVCAEAARQMQEMDRIDTVALDHVDLNVRVRLVHGSEQIADNLNGYEQMCDDFKRWVDQQSVASP